MAGAALSEQLDIPAELTAVWQRNPRIVKLGDPILRRTANAVARVGAETRTLVKDMTDILAEARGLGLAAPQVGASSRVIIWTTDRGVRCLINPRILSAAGEQDEPVEGCLSIPGLQGRVRRALDIRVKGLNRQGKQVTYNATELESRVIQHEIDHLNGILFIDRAEADSLEWIVNPVSPEDDGNGAPRE